jgi:hypothetical protein
MNIQSVTRALGAATGRSAARSPVDNRAGPPCVDAGAIPARPRAAPCGHHPPGVIRAGNCVRGWAGLAQDRTC